MRVRLFPPLAIFLAVAVLLVSGCGSGSGVSQPPDGDRDTDLDSDADPSAPDGDLDAQESEKEQEWSDEADENYEYADWEWTAPEITPRHDSAYNQSSAIKLRFPTGCSNDIRAICPFGESVLIATANGICSGQTVLLNGEVTATLSSTLEWAGHADETEFVDMLATPVGVVAASPHALHVYSSLYDTWTPVMLDPSITVQAIAFAEEIGVGTVFIGSDKGLLRYSLDGVLDPSRTFASHNIRALATHGHLLYIGSDSGLVRLDTQTDVSRNFSVADGLPEAAVSGLAVDPMDGRVIAVCASGAVVVGETELTPLFGEDTVYPHTPLSGIDIHNETIYLHSPHGLMAYNGGWRVYDIALWLHNPQVQNLQPGPNGLWIATADGVTFLANSEKTLRKKARTLDERLQADYMLGDLVAEGFRHQPSNAFKASPTGREPMHTALYAVAECAHFNKEGDLPAIERARAALTELMALESVTGISGYFADSRVPKDATPGGLSDPDGSWRLDAEGEWWWRLSDGDEDFAAFVFALGAYWDICAIASDKPLIAAWLMRVAEHLIENDLRLVGPDGHANPLHDWRAETLAADPDRAGIRALEILAFFTLAWRTNEEPRYLDLLRSLAVDRDYVRYILHQKDMSWQRYQNHTLDLVAFMSFYELARHVPEAAVGAQLEESIGLALAFEDIEDNPLIAVLATAAGRSDALDIVVPQLRSYPLDGTMSNDYPLERNDLDAYVPEAFPTREPEWVVASDGHALAPDQRPPIRLWDNPLGPLDLPDSGEFSRTPADFLATYWIARYHGIIDSGQAIR